MLNRPTQLDVARKAGVSRALVSLALADSPKVGARTKAKILRIAAEMGYARNQYAAFLSSSVSNLIGVILPDLKNPFFEEVEDALRRTAEARGLLTLVATARQDQAREQELIQRFMELRVCGVVLCAPASEEKDLMALATRVPITVLGSRYQRGQVDSVHIDEVAAAELAFQHLIDQGHQAIGVIPTHSHLDQAANERIRAQKTAAHQLRQGNPNFPPVYWVEKNDPSLQQNFYSVNRPWYTNELAPGKILERYLELADGKRLGVIAYNDLLALESYTYLTAQGLQPGVDFGLIGYDNTYLGTLSEFSITSVDQNTNRMGQKAIEMIMNRYEQGFKPDLPGQEEIIAAQLAIRGSTQPK